MRNNVLKLLSDHGKTEKDIKRIDIINDKYGDHYNNISLDLLSSIVKCQHLSSISFIIYGDDFNISSEIGDDNIIYC